IALGGRKAPAPQTTSNVAAIISAKPRYWPTAMARVVPGRPAPRAKNSERTMMSSIFVTAKRPTAWAIVANKGSFLGLGAEYAQGVKVREQYPSFGSAASRVRVAHLKYEHFCSQYHPAPQDHPRLRPRPRRRHRHAPGLGKPEPRAACGHDRR